MTYRSVIQGAVETQRSRALRKAIRIFEEFKRLDPEMPLQQMITLLQVAAYEGISLSELSEKVGNATSSTSRNVGILGEYGRGKSSGLNVVKAVTDPTDRRKQLVYLTAKGEEFIDRLLHLVDSGRPST